MEEASRFTNLGYVIEHHNEYLYPIAAALFICTCAYVWLANLLRTASPEASSRGLKLGKQDYNQQPLCNSLSASTAVITNGSVPYRDDKWNDKYSSMMEQLVPEIMQHTLSYLDYKSLCNMSMTNSVIRRAASDDSAWKSLFHKDFSGEQDTVVAANKWKAHYAVTKAVADANKTFYKKFKAKSLRGMSKLWLQADYVKCIHPGGELLSGYDVVMANWKIVFNWSQRYDFSLDEVRVRVRGESAWVTVKEFVNSSVEPLLATNIFELHDGHWLLVHHHSSPQMEAGTDFGQFG